MKEKKVFYSELAYIAALLILPLGIVLMEKADLGISMVAAPPYLLFLKLHETYPLFSFGFSDYFVQFLILLLLILKSETWPMMHRLTLMQPAQRPWMQVECDLFVLFHPD